MERLRVITMCPDCREVPANLDADYSSGVITCGSCGLVLDDHIIDSRPEWDVALNTGPTGTTPFATMSDYPSSDYSGRGSPSKSEYGGINCYQGDDSSDDSESKTHVPPRSRDGSRTPTPTTPHASPSPAAMDTQLIVPDADATAATAVLPPQIISTIEVLDTNFVPSRARQFSEHIKMLRNPSGHYQGNIRRSSKCISEKLLQVQRTSRMLSLGMECWNANDELRPGHKMGRHKGSRVVGTKRLALLIKMEKLVQDIRTEVGKLEMNQEILARCGTEEGDDTRVNVALSRLSVS